MQTLFSETFNYQNELWAYIIWVKIPYITMMNCDWYLNQFVCQGKLMNDLSIKASLVLFESIPKVHEKPDTWN